MQDAVLTCPFPEQGLEKPPGHGLQLGPKKPLQHFGSYKMKQILLPVIWNNPLFRAGQVEPELPCIYRGTISGRHQGWYQGWGLQHFLKEKKKKRDLQEQGDGMKSVFWADWKRPDWGWPLSGPDFAISRLLFLGRYCIAHWKCPFFLEPLCGGRAQKTSLHLVLVLWQMPAEVAGS